MSPGAFRDSVTTAQRRARWSCRWVPVCNKRPRHFHNAAGQRLVTAEGDRSGFSACLRSIRLAILLLCPS